MTTQAKYTLTVILLIVAAASITLMFYALKNPCCPSLHLNYDDPIQYSQLLETHSLDISAFVGFFGFNIAVILFFFLFSKWSLLLSIPVEIAACCMLVLVLFNSSGGSILSHLETTEFDGHVYHLVKDAGDGWDYYYERLVLFECNADGETCQGGQVIDGGYGAMDVAVGVSFKVDAETLQIIRDDGTALFQISKKDMPYDAAVLQNLEIITRDNVGQLRELFRFYYDARYDLDWSSDGEIVASLGENGIQVHRFKGDHIMTQRLADSTNVHPSIYFQPTQQIISGKRESKILFWDVVSGNQLSPFEVSYADAFAFSPDGSQFAVADRFFLKLYESDTRQELGSWEVDRQNFDKMVFNASGTVLASTGYDSTDGETVFTVVSLEGTDTPTVINRYPGVRPDHLTSDGNSALMAYTTQRSLGSSAFSGPYEIIVHLWDSSDQIEIDSFVIPENDPVTELAFSAGGTMLLTAVTFGFRFWDVETQQELWSLILQPTPDYFTELYPDRVYAAGFRPDGKLLASIHEDGSIRFWGVRQ